MKEYAYIFFNRGLKPVSYCISSIKLTDEQIARCIALEGNDLQLMNDARCFMKSSNYDASMLKKKFCLSVCVDKLKNLDDVWVMVDKLKDLNDVWVIKELLPFNNLVRCVVGIKEVYSYFGGLCFEHEKYNAIYTNDGNSMAIRINFKALKEISYEGIDDIDIVALLFEGSIDKKLLGYTRDIDFAHDCFYSLLDNGMTIDINVVARKNKGIKIVRPKLGLYTNESCGREIVLDNELTDKALAKLLLL